MDTLIPLIAELHDIIDKSNLKNEIQLPQIAVIGSQSTGKSSVLESIIGKEILPRGKGIVTRSPIEIQLIRDDSGKEWIEFSGEKDHVEDFSQVSQMIAEKTEKLAGMAKGISEIPIRLKFYSPKVLNLLLIDLPGITKNPVGDQPDDIEDIIKQKIISPYIKNPNSIILAVSKANDDIANSESLKMAREVDPNGDRTIGVLTQIDLMDRGTDVSGELNNTTYKLKLGYVGVVCRGAANVAEGRTLEEQIQCEKNFFETHPIYKGLSRRLGIPHLISKLNISFIEHIKKALPDLRETIANLIKNKHLELEKLGSFYDFFDESAKGRQILNWIQLFNLKISEVINGSIINNEDNSLNGGARINYILFTLFQNNIVDIMPSNKLTYKDVCSAILNCMGIHKPLIVPEKTFYSLIKKEISRLKPVSLGYTQEIYEDLRKLVYSIDFPEFRNYLNFKHKLKVSIEQIFENSLKECEHFIEAIFEMETNFINISHPEFFETHKKLRELYFEPKIHDENISDGKDSQKKKLNDSMTPFKDASQKKVLHFIKAKLNIISHINEKEYIEKSLITNTNNYMRKKDDYSASISQVCFLNQIPQVIKVDSLLLNGHDEKIIEMLILVLDQYFSIVKKSVGDMVPKSIMTYLIIKPLQNLESFLIEMLYKREEFQSMLEVDPEVMKDRKILIDETNILRKCLSTLDAIGSKF